MLPAQRALISVYDKRGLEEFARSLSAMGIEILATGGTRELLAGAGIPVISVATATGFPELLDGRVKTQHPLIHGGILADRTRASHLTELQKYGVRPIDLVVVNLRPFRETVESGATFEEINEVIDVGGPSVIRAAVKNYHSVIVVVEPDDYPQVQAALEDGGRQVPEPVRHGLALKALRHTQAYDAAIATWFAGRSDEAESRFPRHLQLDLTRELRPSCGENPQQTAAVYHFLGDRGIFGGMKPIQGDELTWRHLLDADVARRQVACFEEPAVVIVQQSSPCGVGLGEDLATAWERALFADPGAAAGAVVAVNRPASRALAQAMANLKVDVLITPGLAQEAGTRFAAEKHLRVISCPGYQPDPAEVRFRAIDGGFLAQSPDAEPDDPSAWKCPTQRRPSEEEWPALELAWKVARGARSAAVVVAHRWQTVGIGARQARAIDSCRLAVARAQPASKGAVAASDGPLTHRDGIDVLAAAGIRALVQPGSSSADPEVTAAADEHDMAMVCTGVGHLRD